MILHPTASPTVFTSTDNPRVVRAGLVAIMDDMEKQMMRDGRLKIDRRPSGRKDEWFIFIHGGYGRVFAEKVRAHYQETSG